MHQTIPEDKYKRMKIGKNVEATGYKSLIYDYSEGFDSPKINNDLIHLSIKNSQFGSSLFELDVRGRDSLLKLKEAIDFALEIEDERSDEKEK